MLFLENPRPILDVDANIVCVCVCACVCGAISVCPVCLGVSVPAVCGDACIFA